MRLSPFNCPKELPVLDNILCKLKKRHPYRWHEGRLNMAENKDFEAIMKEITAGLSGDPETDMKYLDEQGEKYKNHE